MLVVNGDETMSRSAAERITAAFDIREWPEEWAYPHGGFSYVVEIGELQRWISAAANS
jgi:hypothetical protein